MIRVLGDVTALCSDRPTGVGNYVTRLFDAMRVVPEVRFRGVWNLSRLRGSRHECIPEPLRRLSTPRIPWLTGNLMARADIYHGPDFRMPAGLSMARVVTVHDLACFHDGFMRKGFAENGRHRLIDTLSRRPEAVIVPSHAVARELCERFPETQNLVHAVHHGCDHVPTRAGQEFRRPYEFPYFLVVGNVERRKNIGMIANAFAELARHHAEPRLVIAGKTGFEGDAVLAELRTLPCADRIVHIDWVPDELLWALYANALGLVFVSHYEGFGFPALEAMRLGCPVIASDRGSIAEIAEGAALLVPPDEQDAVAAALERLWSDRTLATELGARGAAHAKGFTWERCAQETVAVYRAAMARR